ncbi:MAG TPA: hypothetical protein VIM65_05315 [Cyclobacteriaceae bacterium]
MIRLIFSLAFIFLISSVSYSQQINMVRTFGGAWFERDSIALSQRQVMEIMYMNSDAYREFRTAKHYYTAAGITGFTGGVLLCLPLINTIGGGTPQWGIAAGGFGLLLGTIPLTLAFKNRAQHAVDVYNEQAKTTSRIKTRFYFQGNRAGVVIQF